MSFFSKLKKSAKKLGKFTKKTVSKVARPLLSTGGAIAGFMGGGPAGLVAGSKAGDALGRKIRSIAQKVPTSSSKPKPKPTVTASSASTRSVSVQQSAGLVRVLLERVGASLWLRGGK